MTTKILITMLVITITATAAAEDLAARFAPVQGVVGSGPDHGIWAEILERYLDTGHPSGIARFDYGAVGSDDKIRLQSYLDKLQVSSPLEMNNKALMAYWINLYNALTVQVILNHWPVESIRDIRLGSVLKKGPWDAPLVTVDGEELSLNDIEHGILRPIWRDPRIHYAVNCASLGCPDLASRPYTEEHLEAMLDEAAVAYVSHDRGARMSNGRLILSSIYKWYSEDFGDRDDLMIHLSRYVPPEKAAMFGDYSGPLRYEYDWSVNAP